MATPMRSKSAQQRADEYLRVSHLYRLGVLPTEQPHTDTRGLSEWAKTDVPRAVSVLKQIDLRALETLEGYAADCDRLADAV
ncbi:MAG: hypothetical protein GWN48_04450, partial [Actinobacteria bacterium]|nr:hypothetical protein [Actinomycetota bacterium]